VFSDFKSKLNNSVSQNKSIGFFKKNIFDEANGTKSFTLIELLIVIAILALLMSIIVVAINPSELLKKSRDTKRISSLKSINDALSIFQTTKSNASTGVPFTIYVSVPDSSSTCANLGLPALPIGYTYACSTLANYRKTDGTGWIPVNFDSLDIGSPISSLPIDPTNNISTGLYFTYITGGSWELISKFESLSYIEQVVNDGGTDPSIYEVGTNFTLASYRNFSPLSQTSRNWVGMTAAPNGNIYAAVYNGDIYMQTNGTGNFVALNQTSRNWYGMTAAPNGNVYAAVNGGDIYMQTNGTGNFVALNQTSRNWISIAAAPDGNVYAAVNNEDIYVQVGGTGNFVALSQTSRKWYGMTAAPNGNVYATVYGGDIYMQTNGTGNFVALNQTTRNWVGMTAAPNGNVYAAVNGGDIYMRTNGTGNFVALNQTTRNWVGMTAAPNGNVYAAVIRGDIYMRIDY